MSKEALVVIFIIIVTIIIVMINDNVSVDYQYRFPCDMGSARPSLGRGVALIG